MSDPHTIEEVEQRIRENIALARSARRTAMIGMSAFAALGGLAFLFGAVMLASGNARVGGVLLIMGFADVMILLTIWRRTIVATSGLRPGRCATCRAELGDPNGVLCPACRAAVAERWGFDTGTPSATVQ